MKNSHYFPHDNNSYSDEKIVDLRMKHGIAGYGAFWAIVEQLHQNKGIMQLDSKRLAFALQLDEQVVDSVIRDFGLFEIDNNNFYSQRLLEHFKKRGEISKIRSKAGKKGGLTSSSKQANAKQKQSKSKAKSSKGKERKGKEIKGKERKSKYNTFEFLKNIEHDDLQKLVTDYGCNEAFVYSCIDNMQNWLNTKGYSGEWGDPYKDYLSALRTFIKRDALKIKQEATNESKLTYIDPFNPG